MKIISFVGTRPEIIKNLAFHRAARKLPELEMIFVHTGQNFGENMADCFWGDLKIPLDRSNAKLDRSSPGATAQGLLDFCLEAIRDHKPDVVISNTDTDSAFYSALAGARMKVPVAHFEGGTRCEARFNPEEINRRLADHLSTWIFAINQDAVESLLKEGFTRDEVFQLGDVTLDALQLVLKEKNIPVREGDYDLLTIHRQENANDPRRLSAILTGVANGGHRTVFPVHPRTRDTLNLPELQGLLRSAKNIEILEPQPYPEIARLVAGCRKVISDSGGLRREGYMLGKPVISLVWFIWFKEMSRRGFEITVDADPKKISDAIQNFHPEGSRPPLFGDGHAGEHILKKILSLAHDAA